MHLIGGMNTTYTTRAICPCCNHSGVVGFRGDFTGVTDEVADYLGVRRDAEVLRSCEARAEAALAEIAAEAA